MMSEKYANECLAEIKEWISAIWNDIKGFFDELNNIQERIESQKRLRSTWQIPKNIIKSHQIPIKFPHIRYIRNGI